MPIFLLPIKQTKKRLLFELTLAQKQTKYPKPQFSPHFYLYLRLLIILQLLTTVIKPMANFFGKSEIV
jgi:hypothetical protein